MDRKRSQTPGPATGDGKIDWTVPEDVDAADIFAKAVSEQAKNDTESELQGRDYLAYREHNERRILTVASRRSGRPALAISAAENGTINLSQNGKEINGKPEMARHEIDSAIGSWITGIIAHRALALTADQGITAIVFSDEKVQRTLESAARDILHTMRDRKDLPAWMLDPVTGDRNLEADTITASYITNPQTWQLLRRAGIDARDATTSQYNRAAVNAQALKALEETDPEVAHFYLNNLGEDVANATAEEIVLKVKTATRLTAGMWETFRKIPWQAWKTNNSGVQHNLPRVCSVLERIDAQLLSKPGISEVVRLLSQYSTNAAVAWRHGDSGQPWSNLVSEYLKQSENRRWGPGGHSGHSLNSVADALRDTIATARPWEDGTWDELCERADTWHTDSRNRRQTAATSTDAPAQWTSAIGATEIGQRLYTPALDSQALAELGETLENCIGDYTPSCRRGTSIIFGATENGRTTGAVELALTPAGWTTGQIEGPDNAKPPEGMKEEASLLAAKYQEEVDRREMEKPV